MPGPKTKAPAAPAAAGKRNKVFTPRPPLSAAERLPKLYRALTDQVNDGYFDNAKQTCKKSEWEGIAALTRSSYA